MERIHWSKLWELMEQRDEYGNPKTFQITFAKKSTGEIVKVPSCTCTSIHAKGSTLNILYAGEVDPKKIRKCLILEFNGMSVYL